MWRTDVWKSGNSMTNDEFKKLCLLKKHFSDTNISLPSAGEKCSNPIPVYSDTTKDIFTLSLDRHGITLTKQKLQELHKNAGRKTYTFDELRKKFGI